jgi:hypothetical protein
MRLKANLYRIDHYLVFAGDPATAWTLTLVAASAIAIAYFLAAQLGLTMLTKPSDARVGRRRRYLNYFGSPRRCRGRGGRIARHHCGQPAERSKSGNLHPQRHL